MHVTYGVKNLSELGSQKGTSYVSSFEVARQESPRGNPDTYTATMTVEGTIVLGSDGLSTLDAQDAIDAAILDLENTLATQNTDVILRKDDGDASTHRIEGASAIGGLRVQGPTYSDVSPAEMVTGRKWKFSVSGVFTDSGGAELLEYRESVQISGGGPRYVFQEFPTGQARRYTMADVTVGTMIQSGVQVGRSAHLVLPASIDPTNYIASESGASVARPLYVRGAFRGYQRTWRYVHRKSGAFDLPELGGV